MKEILENLLHIIVGFVGAPIHSLVVSIDRRLPPDPQIVHAILSGVMNDPPSLSKIKLWSVRSRRAAIDWAEEPSRLKPEFF